MNDTNDWNARIIEEFRANDGVVGGSFAGAPMLLLHTTGAKSGKERVNPLVYQQRGSDLVVFASKAGATTHPDWFHNLKANPTVTVEVGAETLTMKSRVAEGDERTVIWEKQKADMPGFAEYEKTANREIPVVVLQPSAG